MSPLHFHQLKWMAESPAHYKYRLTHRTPPTRAMRIGTALDQLVYSMLGFADMPGAYQESTAVTLALGDKPPPKRGASHVTDGAIVLGMYEALRAHSDAWALLTEGTSQRTFQWDLGGRTCEGTPDNFTGSRLVSLKTTRSSHPRRFVRDAGWRGYHAAESWYALGLSLAGLASIDETFIVAVENMAPYCVTVFEVTEEAELAGQKLWRSWFERLRACEESGHFPGYTEARVPFDVPDDGALALTIDGEETEIE
jgi:hypothetical protein